MIQTYFYFCFCSECVFIHIHKYHIIRMKTESSASSLRTVVFFFVLSHTDEPNARPHANKPDRFAYSNQLFYLHAKTVRWITL